MRLPAIVLAAALLCAGPAGAQWDTKVDDDIFSGGKKALLLGFITSDSFLVADCDSSGELSFAYAQVGDWEEAMTLGNFRLLVKVDDNPVIEVAGKAEQRNNRSYQITSSDDAASLEIVRQIGVARRSILVGVEEPSFGMKYSATAKAAGSTSAVKRFLGACSIPVSAG